MKFRALIFAVAGLSAFLCGCASAPGRPVAGDEPVVPSEVTDFKVLYGQNCAGCHGAEGKGGAAIALDDPVYLAIAGALSGNAPSVRMSPAGVTMRNADTPAMPT